MKINIVNITPIKVAALEHLGSPETLEQSVEIFRTWRKESGLSPVAVTRSFGVVHTNPEVMPAQAFRFDVCGEVDEDIPTNQHGVTNKTIVGGRYAKLRHKGLRKDLNQKVNALYRTWLPASDEGKGDAPLFFEYINIATEASEDDAITDIYFPLK